MTKPEICDASINVADDRTLTCVRDVDHDSLHIDADGEQWGDVDTPILPPE